jgi:hypothetical protein
MLFLIGLVASFFGLLNYEVIDIYFKENGFLGFHVLSYYEFGLFGWFSLYCLTVLIWWNVTIKCLKGKYGKSLQEFMFRFSILNNIVLLLWFVLAGYFMAMAF